MGQLTVSSNISPIVPRLRTKMKYSELVVYSGLPLVEYLFNLNSLFDPNQTGTGHQPLGFDQIKAMYQKYRVYKCKYYVAYSTSTNVSVRATVVASNTATGLGNMDVAAEQPYSKTTSTTLTAAKPTTVQGIIDLPTLNGKTYQQYAGDDVTAALISGSPTENLTLHVMASTCDGTNLTATFAHVILEYDCEFFDPVQLSAS